MRRTPQARGPSLFSVLLVEDQPELRAMLAEALEHGGMAVTPCADVAEAREALRASIPDAVLTDLHLGRAPGGVDLARDLRKEERTADVTIVLMSGTGSPGREMERLFDAVLMKPIDAMRLPETLRRLAAERLRVR